MLTKRFISLKKPLSNLFINNTAKCFASDTKFEKFDFEDPFKLEGLLTSDEKMIRDSARSYAQEKLMPRIRQAYNDEFFDTDILKEMGELGFLGCTLNSYDLPGISSTAYGKQ